MKMTYLKIQKNGRTFAEIKSGSHFMSTILMIWPVMIFLAFVVGFRPFFIGSDTPAYALYFKNLKLGVEGNYEFLFQFLAKYFASLNIPVGYFFTSIALINYILIGFLARKISEFLGSSAYSRLIFLLLIICFSLSIFFYSVEINVIRNGTAILAILLFYFLLLCRSHPVFLILAAAVAMGFHQTAIIYLLLSFLVFFSYSLVANGVYCLSLLYMTGLLKKCLILFSHLTSIKIYEKIAAYGVNSGYASGIRLDFALFTIISGIAFFVIGKYLLGGENKKQFTQILKVYWILTIPFFLFGFAGFADRYLLPAWLYLSILAAVFLFFSIRQSKIAIKASYLVFIMTSIVMTVIVQGLF